MEIFTQFPNSLGETPLHVAAGASAVVACHFMLKHGANANAIDASGLTPLCYAIDGENCSTAFVNLLRGLGCHLPSDVLVCAREANLMAREGRLHQLRLYRYAGLTLTVGPVGIGYFLMGMPLWSLLYIISNIIKEISPLLTEVR